MPFSLLEPAGYSALRRPETSVFHQQTHSAFGKGIRIVTPALRAGRVAGVCDVPKPGPVPGAVLAM